MIRKTAFSVVLLILFCSALEYDAENATVTTTENVVDVVEQITENLGVVEDQKIADPVIDRSSHYHEDRFHEPTYHGFWKKKVVWRPRWVKTWQAKKIYVAVWKRMWGPAMLNEWVPIPKPPPGWVKHGVGSFIVQNPH